MDSRSSERQAGRTFMTFSVGALGVMLGGLVLIGAGARGVGQLLIWLGLLTVVGAPFVVLLQLVRGAGPETRRPALYAAATLLVVVLGAVLALN